jgi:non-specific serine/threonine protein kinase
MEEIAERLGGSPGLLARHGAGPARHQTLRTSVLWSHQLLSAQEQVLFRRLAVFTGGWGLEAAEAACALPPLAPEEVAGLLAALVDKSLVQVEQTRAGSRYRLLEVIRTFASEQLADTGDLDPVRERHAGYYLELAERSTVMLLGPGLPTWAARLDQETGNMRAARSWFDQDLARAEAGLRLAAALYQWWAIRGHLVEGAAWLEEALAREGGEERTRAMALVGLGLIASYRGEQQRALGLLTRSVECSQRCGYQRVEARALIHLGPVRALCGDAAGGADACARAVALARDLEDTWLEACALFRSAFTAALSGDIVLAKPLALASVALSPRTEDPRMRGFTLMTLADCLTREGQPAEAVELLRDALGVFEALPERWALLRAASLLAEACGALGDWPRAAMLLGVIETLSERIGGRPYAHFQARLDALATQAPNELGQGWGPAREAGRTLGRGDQISAALWPEGSQAAVPPAATGLPLTPREGEVAELIARGLTNRQIAARLFIAERTVDTHVGRIIAKLGCANRAQVAAIVVASSVTNEPASPQQTAAS